MNTGFQKAAFAGISMFVQGWAKFFFGIGVQLFLMLTRYLQGKKEATPQYYRGALSYCPVPLLFACSYVTAWLKVKLLRF